MQRRTFLRAAAAGGATLPTLGPSWSRGAAAAPAERIPDPFAGHSPDAIVRELFGHSPARVGGGLGLDVPLMVDGGAIDVSLSFAPGRTARAAIVAPDCRAPLCAVLTPAAGVVAFRTRVRLARGPARTSIFAYAQIAAVLCVASAKVRVTAGSYGMPPLASRAAPVERRTARTRIKARALGSRTKVIAQVEEPAVSQGSGVSILRRRLLFAIDGAPVASVELGPCAASGLLAGITTDGRRVGSEVALKWTDDRGGHGGATTIVQ